MLKLEGLKKEKQNHYRKSAGHVITNTIFFNKITEKSIHISQEF